LWVITLHKLILVDEIAPQNHSCGVVVPPQTHSSSGNGRKHEMQMEIKMREILFFLFLMNLRQEKEY
jgi:hypothetical protein